MQKNNSEAKASEEEAERNGANDSEPENYMNEMANSSLASGLKD